MLKRLGILEKHHKRFREKTYLLALVKAVVSITCCEQISDATLDTFGKDCRRRLQMFLCLICPLIIEAALTRLNNAFPN